MAAKKRPKAKQDPKREERSEACLKCNQCDGTLCSSLETEMYKDFSYPDQFPQTYKGLRLTADAMDCSLPIAMDSHSGCSYNCLYCFSNNLMRAPDRNPRIIQRAIREGSFYNEWSIKNLERFLARDAKDKVSQAIYPLLDAGVPLQLGALGEPFDDIEEHSGWAKKAIPLFIKYGIPVRIGTKGGKLLQKKEYLKLFEDSPDQFWFAFSIICNDDELLEKIDIKAPNATERFKAMDALTKLGCNASIRFRPFLPGVSDATPKDPNAWESLIERAADNGARAISFEYIFLNPVPTERQKKMYKLMFRNMNWPNFDKDWHGMSKNSETCRRATRDFKYQMTKNIYDLVHSLNMTFGCSDPHFKEWNDTGSCCGMPDYGDKWFSNWSRKQMTEVVVQARKAYERGEERYFNYLDWKPKWAHKIQLREMVAIQNWHRYRQYYYTTFGDQMRKKWNDPKHPRGPLQYFDGVLVPIGTDQNEDLVYKYRPWQGKDNKIRPSNE